MSERTYRYGNSSKNRSRGYAGTLLCNTETLAYKQLLRLLLAPTVKVTPYPVKGWVSASSWVVLGTEPGRASAPALPPPQMTPSTIQLLPPTTWPISGSTLPQICTQKLSCEACNSAGGSCSPGPLWPQVRKTDRKQAGRREESFAIATVVASPRLSECFLSTSIILLLNVTLQN